MGDQVSFHITLILVKCLSDCQPAQMNQIDTLPIWNRCRFRFEIKWSSIQLVKVPPCLNAQYSNMLNLPGACSDHFG